MDLYLTSHHGIDQSGSPVLVHALHPRVAIMHNGPHKGGAVPTMQTLYTSPGLENIWQLHWSYAAGAEFNAPSLFIANLEDPATGHSGHTGPAFWIRVSAHPDGSFVVTNTRNHLARPTPHERMSDAGSANRDEPYGATPPGASFNFKTVRELTWRFSKVESLGCVAAFGPSE